ncbi:hypothetical protein ACHAPX_001886 [Trichoderma viride]|jgi:hypothetical protein
MEAKNTRQRLCPHIEDRDIERKEFRDNFNRELAERKSWEEQFLGGERKAERKAEAKAPPSPPNTPEPEEQKEVQQEDRADKLRERLAADMLDQEIRAHKFMAEVEEVRNRQDELYERMEEQRKKMAGEAVEERD